MYYVAKSKKDSQSVASLPSWMELVGHGSLHSSSPLVSWVSEEEAEAAAFAPPEEGKEGGADGEKKHESSSERADGSGWKRERERERVRVHPSQGKEEGMRDLDFSSICT